MEIRTFRSETLYTDQHRSASVRAGGLALKVGIVILAGVAAAQCSSVNGSEHSAGRSTAVTQSYGTQCVPYGGTVPSGPKSYLVKDLGKPDVPRLSSVQLRTIRAIRRYVASPTLRFTFTDYQGFTIFDADKGPCLDLAGGYPVLNGSCNEFYEPGEDPTTTSAAPGCLGTSPPWAKAISRLPRRGASQP